MMKFIFDLQRFANVTLLSGETYSLNGVTYTAITDAILNLDDNKISGIASGKVSTVVTDKTDPMITVDASQTEIPIAITAEDDSLAVKLSGRTFTFAEGTATITNDKVTTGVATFSVSGTYSNADYKFTVEDSAEFSVTTDFFSITSEKLSVDVSRGDRTLKFEISGTATRNFTDHTFTLAGGTTISTTLGDYTFNAKMPDDASVEFNLTESGIIFSPENDGSISISLERNGAVAFQNDVTVNGSVIINPVTNSLTLPDGSEISAEFDDYKVTATADGDATVSFALTESGLTITPNKDDGHLELSVTRDGETRTASLEMTGSLTYKLDGSISLAKDTVLKNVFEDGNILTITALTDASGSIVFNSQNGLTITPAMPNALNVAVSNSNGVELVNISSIDGSINYSGGLVTASDGTSAHLLYYHTWESEMRTTGGTASLQFTADSLALTANEGATFVLDYLDGTTLEIQNGSYTDIYPTETGDAVEIVSEGINLRTNDDYPLTLEKAGTYTLNGMNVTTTEDNTPIMLSDYKTITVDGISYTPLDDNVTITIGENVTTVSGGKVSVLVAGTEIPLEVDVTDSSLSFDSATKKFTFAEGAILSMQAGTSALQFVAKEDFSISVDDTDDKISFKLDGAAEVEIVNGDRKATLDFTGGLVYESGGKTSLDDGTEINLAWEDGTELKITSNGSTGSIAFDADKGLKITSDDENLDMTLTTPYMSTNLSGLKGTIYYKAGTISFDANSTITATTTLGGQPILTTLETVDGTGHLSFGSDINGIIYSADTGAMKITWSRNDLESTFTVNSGSVQIGHGLFKIAKGTNLATDLKNFVPALYFTTSEAGTYTINGQKITTSAEGLALTATDDQMVFKTSDDVVEYDGMTFAGNGNVSLKPDSVVLGAGVEATGFGESKSFVLAEAGNVTADAKVFELTPLNLVRGGESVPIPMIITVTGAQDGFIFSRELTDESEEYLGYVDSPYVGQVFVEKFISAGDSSYRTRTDPIGLEEVIGISDGATITGGASLDDEPTLSYYNLVTDTTGKFTIGEKTYAVSGDSSIALRARFEENAAPYASMVDSLNGTISGDFSGGEFKVNGSSAMKIFSDTDVSIVADDSGFEILGLDAGSSLQVSAAGNYSVNGTAIAAGASDIIVGTSRGTARLYDEHYIFNALSNTLITGTDQSDTIENIGTTVTIQALGGDDYIINNVDSTVTAAEFGNLIEAGDGNDTVYNHHTYNPTIYGGAGDDSIVISRGHKTFIDSGEGNDSIIGRFANNPASDWAIGGHATVLGGEGNDYISTGYTNDSSIDGGKGDDTIITCGLNNTINGGDGNNLISLDVIDREDLSQGSFIVLNGNTTVEGFATGFGEGTDTVYITGESPAVDFKADGLTLYYDDDSTKSLTFAGLSTTDKLNLYYEASLKSVAEVFIADDEWYSVTEDDLSVMNDRELFFVGATAKMNHGIDFSGITGDVNATLLGHNYPDYVENLWINNIHSIKGGAGLTTITGSDKDDTIVAGTGDITINAAGGDDVINLGSASALVKYNSGDGNDLIRGFNENSTLNISGAFYSSKKRGNNLVLTVGEDEITLQGAANLSTVNIDGTSKTQAIIESISAENYTVVDAAETGTKNISLSGAEVVVVEDTRAKVSIMASDDEDSIFSDGQNVTVNLDNGGNSWLFVTGGKMTLEGYDNTTGAGFNEPYDDIVSEIADKILSEEITFDDGKLSMGAAVVSFGKVKNEIVNFYNALVLDELQQVGFASKGNFLDTSNKTANLILVGNTDSTLTSGAGNDTIFADDGGFVDAGVGNNLVDLSKGDKYGTTVAFTSKGNTTVDGFNVGFDKSSDILFFNANDSIRLEFDGNDITLNSDNGATGLISDVADDAPFVEIFVADEADTTKMIIAKKDATITPDDLTARVYIGENSAVDFSNATKNLSIDLSGIVDTNSDNPLMFSGITQITAGNGQNTIIGSDADETLIAGSSENSIYGAGGHNLLQGYSGDDKDGSTKFFVLGANDGAANTISNFSFVNDENHATSADVIEIDAGANFIRPESIAVRGNDVAFTVENSRTGAKESVLIENAASTSDNVKDMYITDDVIAQISANDLCVDEFANFYVATGSNATVNVSSAIDSEIVLWLDDDAAAENEVEVSAIFAGDIKVIDATKSDATAQLAGNELDNEIYAGNGDASLWGGNGGDDFLVGGTAQNMFFYTLGNGNDTVTGVNDGDSVILSGVKLEDIIGADFTNNSLSLDFSDGGKLTVNENGKDVNFVVGEQTFRVNSERNDFTAK